MNKLPKDILIKHIIPNIETKYIDQIKKLKEKVEEYETLLKKIQDLAVNFGIYIEECEVCEKSEVYHEHADFDLVECYNCGMRAHPECHNQYDHDD